MKKTEVKFYSKGDNDKNGSVLFFANSRKEAAAYVKEWINAHATKVYPFHKVAGMNRWESQFTAIYF